MGRVSLSGQALTLPEVARHYSAVTAATYDFFANTDLLALKAHPGLAGYTGLPMHEVRSTVLTEIDHTSALSVLSCVEAAVRSDYLRRVYDREKDDVSRALRAIYKLRQERARLDNDLLFCWRDHSGVSKALVRDLIGAFNYRNWLAHGRYWTPRFGRRYDFSTVYPIAHAFLTFIFSRELDVSGNAAPR